MIWLPNGVASGDNDKLREHIPRAGIEAAVRRARGEKNYK